MKISKTKLNRKNRIKAKIRGTGSLPRLSVFRSNKGVYAQVIDDEKMITLVSASLSDIKEKMAKTEIAKKVGELIAQKALKKNITKVVFDRGIYKYHGIIKAVAESARENGLKI